MSAYDLLKTAILQKKIVVATYHGHRRRMCPHLLGSKGGVKVALVYQFAGGSRRGLAPDGSESNWRCLAVSKLRDVTLEDGEWHTAANYSREQHCVGRIDASVWH